MTARPKCCSHQTPKCSRGKIPLRVAEKPNRLKVALLIAALLAQDAFILDAGASGIYAWVGRRSTKDEKLEAMKKGEKYLSDNKYPSWTKVGKSTNWTADCVSCAPTPPSFPLHFWAFGCPHPNLALDTLIPMLPPL